MARCRATSASIPSPPPRALPAVARVLPIKVLNSTPAQMAQLCGSLSQQLAGGSLQPRCVLRLTLRHNSWDVDPGADRPAPLVCRRGGPHVPRRRAALLHVTTASVVVSGQSSARAGHCSWRATGAAAAAASCPVCCQPPDPTALVLQEPGSTVLVAGATGGVGQLLTAKLLDVSGWLWAGDALVRTRCSLLHRPRDAVCPLTAACTPCPDPLLPAARLQGARVEPQRRQGAPAVWRRSRAQRGHC